MDTANDILGFDIKSMIFYGTEDSLRLTEIAQPALYIVSGMYFEKFKQLNEGFKLIKLYLITQILILYLI